MFCPYFFYLDLCILILLTHRFLPTDMMKLHKSKEQSDRLDAENRALKEKVNTLEEEKKTLLDQVNRLLFAEFVYLKKKNNKKQKKTCNTFLLFGVCSVGNK